MSNQTTSSVELSHVPVIDRLNQNIASLGASDMKFAMSLIAAVLSGRTLSPKQAHWADILLERATTPQPDPVEVSVTGVFTLFGIAKQKIRYPKIRLSVEIDGEIRPVVLSVAGERSKNPGTINVTDGGRFGNNIWYGRISCEGKFEQNRCTLDGLDQIIELLQSLSCDPHLITGDYGRVTGSCSFCAKELTDKRSISAGYGPTCADNYGLPWG